MVDNAVSKTLLGGRGAVRLPALLALLLGLAGLIATMVPRGTQAQQLRGTVLNGESAPNFSLRDQWGHVVTLTQFRGRPVVVTFMQATCTQLCPVTAETIHRTIAELGLAPRQVGFIAISVDPEHDTRAAVVQFSRRHGLLTRWHYLTASRNRLTPIWRAYHLYVAPANAPRALAQSHTSATYLVDAQGRERVLEGGAPFGDDLRVDLSLMLGHGAPVGGSFSVPAPESGHPAPGFALTSLTGSRVSLASLRGKVVVLNFWATWCTACKSEIPLLSRWYRHMDGRGVVVVGVDDGETRGEVSAYLRTLSIPYPVLLDTGGNVSALYDAAYLPKSVIVDQQGVVRSVKLGALTDSDLATHAQSLLRGQT